ncbi:MAG: sigma 54-interacting transcriptional regulator [Candidatus Moduliflexus flocculans]|nr:sigma 54-interacting transcriptional regulator [Candidatus Moduliflexus flocculans]
MRGDLPTLIEQDRPDDVHRPDHGRDRAPARSWWRGRIHRELAARGARRSSRSTAARSRRTCSSRELFGHEKGAFTGAVSAATGLLRGGRRRHALPRRDRRAAARRCRSSCCACCRSDAFERVGGSARRSSVDVRIIAATNRDLDRRGRPGSFREDLYYRLNVMPIHAAAAARAARGHPLLVRHFLEDGLPRSRDPEKKISTEAMRVLEAHPWPGNVREAREPDRADRRPRAGDRHHDRLPSRELPAARRASRTSRSRAPFDLPLESFALEAYLEWIGKRPDAAGARAGRTASGRTRRSSSGCRSARSATTPRSTASATTRRRSPMTNPGRPLDEA